MNILIICQNARDQREKQRGEEEGKTEKGKEIMFTYEV